MRLARFRSSLYSTSKLGAQSSKDTDKPATPAPKDVYGKSNTTVEKDKAVTDTETGKDKKSGEKKKSIEKTS